MRTLKRNFNLLHFVDLTWNYHAVNAVDDVALVLRLLVHLAELPLVLLPRDELVGGRLQHTAHCIFGLDRGLTHFRRRSVVTVISGKGMLTPRLELLNGLVALIDELVHVVLVLRQVRDARGFAFEFVLPVVDVRATAIPIVTASATHVPPLQALGRVNRVPGCLRIAAWEATWL